MRTIKLTIALCLLVGLVFLANNLSGQSSKAATLEERVNAHWKGSASFSPVGAGPNVARCGAFPENVEVTFAGSGLDSDGGAFNNSTSACTNTTTGLIFDLKATDTYITSGDSILIESDPVTPVLNPDTCVATNSQAVGFRVAGGTGAHTGATGQGRYHIATNDTACNGLAQPTRVWFEGVIKLAQ